ncbi:hypothetical protein H8D29_00105 [PVC group bacterium]|nr:hypothetical protein [PVC group bacterium]
MADDVAIWSPCAEAYLERKAEAVDRLTTGLWRMKCGKEIHISDMDSSHLKSSIAMIKRNEERPMHALAIAWIEKFEEELKKRPNPHPEWNP